MADTLKEFLVSLGYHIDAESERSFTSSLVKTGAAAVASGNLISEAAEKIASYTAGAVNSLNNLFVASRELHVPVATLQALTVAFQKTGMSAQQSQGFVEGFFSVYQRTPQVTKAVLDAFGVKQSNDPLQRLMDLPRALHQLEQTQGRARAALLMQGLGPQAGLDPNMLLLLAGNSDTATAALKNAAEQLKKNADSLEAAAKGAEELRNAWIDLGNVVNLTTYRMTTAVDGMFKSMGESGDTTFKEISDILNNFFPNLPPGFVLLQKFWDDLKVKISAVVDEIKQIDTDPLGYAKTQIETGVHNMETDTRPWWKRALDAVGGTWNYMTGGGSSDNTNAPATSPPPAPTTGAPTGSNAPAPTNLNAPGGASLTDLINKVSAQEGIDPRLMEGIRAGESLHGSRYDIGDRGDGPAYGPFQLNVGRGRLGDIFQRQTGLDLRDPKTIPAQAEWVARYIKRLQDQGKLGELNSIWHGFHGLREANSRWGNAGYTPAQPKNFPLVTPAEAATPKVPKGGYIAHDHEGNPIAVDKNGNAIQTSPYGALDVHHKFPPLGHVPTPPAPADDGKQSHNIEQHNSTNIHVTGQNDPYQTALNINRLQDRTNARHIRNLQGAVA